MHILLSNNYKSACRLLLSTPTISVYYYHSGWYSLYWPMKGRRLSWPRHAVRVWWLYCKLVTLTARSHCKYTWQHVTEKYWTNWRLNWANKRTVCSYRDDNWYEEHKNTLKDQTEITHQTVRIICIKDCIMTEGRVRTTLIGMVWRRIWKGKGQDIHYSAAYMSQTRDQQRFTISEVAAYWHEPMVPQRIMWPSIACANGQLDPRCS